MSKNEMISLIETMNNYDDLATKAKAKADAIREAIKEEMVRQNTEELSAGAYILRDNSCHVLVKRYGVRLVILAAYLQNEPRIIHKRHKIIPPLFLPLLASSRRALSKWCIF